jgi:hypothetical protein
MGFWDFLFGAFVATNVLDTRDPGRPHGDLPSDDDDEARFDDGYSDDYVGDGLDGDDDYVGDGLDGDDDDDDYGDDPG